jgi:predicted dehydrogenase
MNRSPTGHVSPVRWGILATGGIARTFTEDLLRLDDHEVVAVGSRAMSSARAFADRYGIERAYGSYEALATDDEVDVVYVATPHSGHFRAARTCLLAGRAVLVEKPLTVTAAEALEIAELAKGRGLFAMEAMWTRFNPLIRQICELVKTGDLGDIVLVQADFSERVRFDADDRMWNPSLAGGALLDLGVYPISFGSMLLGEPTEIRALTSHAATGVDANTAIIGRYARGALGVYHCGLWADSPLTAAITGTEGTIMIAAPFYRPHSFTLQKRSAAPQTFSITLEGHGYTYQAAEVARCLRAGLTESPTMPLAETVSIMRTLDAVRAALAAEAPEHLPG